MTERLLLTYRLPWSFVVATEVLGTAVLSVVGGHEALIHMPTQAVEGDDLAAPTAIAAAGVTTSLRWGGRTLPRKDGTAAWRANAVAIEFACDSPDAALGLSGGCLAWFEGIRPWVEALTGQDLNPSYDYAQQTTKISFFGVDGWLIAEGSEPAEVDFPLDVDSVWYDDNDLSLDEWRRVCAEAPGASPPPELGLLRDAEIALARGDTRRAVIDGGTSIELCLGKMLDDVANQANPDVASLLRRMSENWTLRNYRSTLEALVTVRLPKTLTTDVVKIRNKVVHKGSQPTQGDAIAVVDAAVDAARLHHPGLRARSREVRQVEGWPPPSYKPAMRRRK